jgi:lycopene cyclase domain-containing protein
MPGVYLLVLLVGLAGMITLDLRHKLALPISWRNTVFTVAFSVLFFLAWDLAGIYLGIFFKGNSHLLIGLDVAPEVPIEEPIFLTLLSYSTLVIYRALLKRKARK